MNDKRSYHTNKRGDSRRPRDTKRDSKNYKQKSPYEMNFFCFDIKDFKNMDSITVYDPETKEKVKGVVTGTDTMSREITFNTLHSNGVKTNINNVLFLKEYDREWLE
jgi:hypothetical protein